MTDIEYNDMRRLYSILCHHSYCVTYENLFSQDQSGFIKIVGTRWNKIVAKKINKKILPFAKSLKSSLLNKRTLTLSDTYHLVPFFFYIL